MNVLPLPHTMSRGEAVRALRPGVLRVRADASVPDAVAALLRRAFALEIAPEADDPDVELVVGAVDAPDAVGTDPRREAGAGQPEAYRIRAEEGGRLRVTGAGPEALFRGLVTIASAVEGGMLPALTVDDRPRFAWRGLSLDVVRRWYPVDEVERVIDLLAIHKLNVLHLHLTDGQAWRYVVPGYPGLTAEHEHYSPADLDHLVAYARARHVTVVPEVDFPGHVAPSLPGIVEVTEGPHPLLRYLESEGAGVAAFARAALAELAARVDGPYLHIGGDEAFGDPAETYAAFVREAIAEVHRLGRRVIGWQEVSRAGGLEATDLAQLWIAELDRFDPVRAQETMPERYRPFIPMLAETFAESAGDPARLADAGIPVIVSSSDPLYLDRKPSEPSVDPAQTARFETLGHPGYAPTRSTDVLRWEPTAQADIRETGLAVAGIEAALWAETITDLDDVALLLLPRLGFVAQRAWGDADASASDAIAAARAYPPVWERLGFGSFYRSSEVFS